MAHFAQIKDGVVERVIAVHNNELLIDGVENEEAGVAFLRTLYGPDTEWKQTSYTGSLRKNFAGIGDSYDELRDAFIAPKPFPSWSIAETSCRWVPPVPYPDDGSRYTWSEGSTSWVLTQ